MTRYKLFNFLILIMGLLILWSSLTLLTQAAPLASSAQKGPDPPAFGLINAAALVTCHNNYFHNQSQNVGPDGNQKIANTTAPTATLPVVAEVTLPVVSLPILLVDTEIARFYATPPLTTPLHLSGDIIGLIWLQTTNFEKTTFIAKIIDYNPTTGQQTPLGNLEFKLLSDGQNETLLNITPPSVIIPAGHRLLFILSARPDLLTIPAPVVKLFYDSSDRASHLRVCQITPPTLTISKSGPIAAIAGQPITYTLAVTNSGGLTATNLLISDTLPTGAAYLSGGTHSGNVVTWSVSSLAPGSAIQRVFVVSATGTITNHTYQVSADDNISATGQKSVVTVVSQPGQPNLFITKKAPETAEAMARITYTLTLANQGDTAATHLRITDTVPAGAHYITGGTRSGNIVTWTINSLAAATNVEVTFIVTASTSLTNSDYKVTADGPALATGQDAVVTRIIPPVYKTYLPTLIKSEKPTTLIVQSTNTGIINPVRVFNSDNQEILTCIVQNNASETCGAFFVTDNYYKIVAYTSRCGVLQGAFTDAAPGVVVTRQIICN